MAVYILEIICLMTILFVILVQCYPKISYWMWVSVTYIKLPFDYINIWKSISWMNIIWFISSVLTKDHGDLYFTILLFCLISWKLFNGWTLYLEYMFSVAPKVGSLKERYIVGYIIGNYVLRLSWRVAVKRNFRPYNRRYTSPNNNFKYCYPLIYRKY